MGFDDIFLETIVSLPIDANHHIGDLDLPGNGLLEGEWTPHAVDGFFPLENFAFLELEADRTSTRVIHNGYQVGEVFSIQILLKPIQADFLGHLFLFRVSSDCLGGVEGIDMFFFVLELCLIGADKSFELEIDEIVELFPPHPARQGNNQRYIADFHIVGGLVEVPLLKPEMVLLAVEVTLGGEVCYCGLVDIVVDLPMLAFAELVDDPDHIDIMMTIRGEVLLISLSEYPPSCVVPAVDELPNFYLFFFVVYFLAVVLVDEVREIHFELIGEYYVRVAEKQLV